MTSAVPTAPAAPTGTVGTPGVCTLGDLTFRVGPSQIAWEYHMDSTVINTIGGRVVQVYGATLSDLTVQGLFGQRYSRSGNVIPLSSSSMEMARAFATQIQQMVDRQGQRPSKEQLIRTDRTPMNPTVRFTYTGDGVHQWDFQVYIKSLQDITDPGYALSHSTGKYSYGYNLTLFIVEDHTGELTKVATDDYIERLSKGIGWQRTTYNGPMTKEELQKYLQANSPDGTIHGLILKEYEDAAKGAIPAQGTIAKSPIPGGADTAGSAQGLGVGTGANPAAPPTGTPGTGPNQGGVTGPVTPGTGGAPPIVVPGL